jgi:hypothetical protein
MFAALQLGACGGLHTPEGDPTLMPGGALVGRIEAGLREADAPPLELAVQIDGIERRVFLGDDNTFAVKELPEGSAHIEVTVGEQQLGVDLANLTVGELVELDVVVSPTAMTVQEIKRNPELLAYHLPVQRRGGIEILESNSVFFLDAGDYAGGITIRGQGVRLFAVNADEECDSRGRAEFEGDIVILGNEVQLYDINTRGMVRMGGTGIRVQSACDDLWVSDAAPSLIDDVGGSGGIGGIGSIF